MNVKTVEAPGSQMIAAYAGRTVLAIGAHPDDIEIGIGGTLAHLSRAGARVINVIASIPSNLEQRKEEATRAAKLLGADIRFLSPDRCNRVEDLKTYELVDKIDELIEELRPAALLSHGLANFHKDHIMVYNACVAAQRLHFFDFFCYYPTSTRPIPVPFHPQAYVDISETIEDKMESIHIHSSQFHNRSLTTDHYRDTAREYGRLAGVEYAEGLEVIRMRLN